MSAYSAWRYNHQIKHHICHVTDAKYGRSRAHCTVTWRDPITLAKAYRCVPKFPKIRIDEYIFRTIIMAHVWINLFHQWSEQTIMLKWIPTIWILSSKDWSKILACFHWPRSLIDQSVLTNEKIFLPLESIEVATVYFQWRLKQQRRKMAESSELQII